MQAAHVVTSRAFALAGGVREGGAFESSLVLVSNPSPIFLLVAPIKTPWFTKLDIGAFVTLG